jgi:hypothetical protein
MSNYRSAYFGRNLFIILGILLSSCSSGNGDGSGNQEPSAKVDPPVYTGIDTEANLGLNNSPVFISLLFGTADTGEILDLNSSKPVNKNSNLIHILTTITTTAEKTVQSPDNSSDTANNTSNGAVSGSFETVGELSPDGTGTVTVVFNNYNDGEGTLNGEMDLTVVAVDSTVQQPSDAIFKIEAIAFQDNSNNYVFSGAIHLVSDYTQSIETATMNLVIQDNVTKSTLKLVDFIVQSSYDNLLNPTLYSEMLTGRLFHSDYGFVDIYTLYSLQYYNIMDIYPSSGGPVIFSGSLGTTLALTAYSSADSNIIMDTNGDSFYDYQANINWATFTGAYSSVQYQVYDDSVPAPSNLPPVAVSPEKLQLTLNSTVYLDASQSYDNNGDTITYQWSLLSTPANSTASLLNPTQAIAYFPADKVGEYKAQLIVNDGETDSMPLSVSIVIIDTTLEILPFNVIDAEYSKFLDKIIIASDNPAAVHIFDPATLTDNSVSLNMAPTSISVSPNGQFAAVGHSQSVSYVDLNALTVSKTFAVSIDVSDLVLAENGFIYPYGSNNSDIISINTINDSVTTTYGSLAYGLNVKLHSNGTSIYGANNGLSPDDVVKIDITNGAAAYLYDSKYHGDFNFCGNLWLTEHDNDIITKCGNVFFSSNKATNDIIFKKKLPIASAIQDAISPTILNRIVLIPTQYNPYSSPSNTITDDQRIEIFTNSNVLENSVLLPSYFDNQQLLIGHGRFVFANQQNSEVYALLLNESEDQTKSTYGLVRYNIGAALHITKPVAIANVQETTFVDGSPVVLDGTQSGDANGDTITYQWNLKSKPAGSNTAIFDPSAATTSLIPDKTGIYVIELTVNDGNESSEVDSVSLSAYAPFTTNCTSDEIPATIPVSGSIEINYGKNFVALCHGWIAAADRIQNSINLVNVFTNTIYKSYQLTAAPGDIELDSINNYLYVAMPPSTAITRLDLTNGDQLSIPLSAAPSDLSLGLNGRVFALLPASSSLNNQVAIIDGINATVDKYVTGTFGYYIAFDTVNNKLFAGGSGLSRYAFDDTVVPPTLTLEQALSSSSNNPQGLTVSPDGAHIAYPSGGGNGLGYTIFDYSAADLTTVFGEWATGAYPSAAAFSLDSQYLIASDSSAIQVFTIDTHVLLQSQQLAGCSYGDLQKVGISRGSSLIFGLEACGFPGDNVTSNMTWAILQ